MTYRGLCLWSGCLVTITYGSYLDNGEYLTGMSPFFYYGMKNHLLASYTSILIHNVSGLGFIVGRC